MNGRDFVRSTMRRGFRAYFNACIPSQTHTAMVVLATEEQRARIPATPPRRQSCQSPVEPDTNGFVAHVCATEGIPNCAICYEAIEKGQNVLSLCCTETAFHSFHEACVAPWLKDKGNCPICHESMFQSTEPLKGLKCGHGESRLN